VSTVFDERKEWLEQREQGLGGTDISAVLNLNPWKTPLDVYLGKIGAAERREPTEAMFWGNKLERIILERYAELTGYRVCPPANIQELYPDRSTAWNGQTLIKHAALPFILGTPDGIAYEVGRGVEIKTAAFRGSEWGKAGTDEVPNHYRLQVAQYMAITGLDVWDLAVVFSGNKFELFTVRRDRDLEDACLSAGAEFWKGNVVAKVPPRIDGSTSWQRHLSRTFAVGNQTMIAATAEIQEAASNLHGAQEAIRTAEADELLYKNTLAALLGENKGAKLEDGAKVQWVRPRASSETDWEALALSLKPTPEQVTAFTSQKSKSAYVRLYEAKQPQ
jgi:predicted phage-related endonuclease